jgi:hypothetical protein
MRLFAFLVAASVGLAGAVPALAARGADPNRMLLLAAEAASAAHGPAAGVALPAWGWAAGIAGTLVSAFAGAYLALRRFSISQVRSHDDWREVTYRFRTSGPLRFGTEMVELLGGVAAELERLAHRRSRRDAPQADATAPRAAAADEQPPDSLASATRTGVAREERTEAYRRARSLLGQGHDAWTVRELTGLKLAELDLIASSTGQTPAPTLGPR